MDNTLGRNSAPVLAFHVRSPNLGYDLCSAARAFGLIRDLGGNGIRFDTYWSDIEPELNMWNKEKMKWYKDFYSAVASFGLEPIAVLISVPRWAARLLHHDKGKFLKRWQIFCEHATEVLDGHVKLVQVWNEPNNPLLSLTDPTNPCVGILNWYFFYEMLGTAARSLRSAISPLEIIVNVSGDTLFWEQFTSNCVRHAGEAFDIIGLDYYPGTYTFTNWRSLKNLQCLLKRVNDPRDLWFGKQAALPEFGASTFLPLLRSEARQRAWVETVFQSVREQNQVWRERCANSLRLISWYQLFGEPSRLPLNPLAHFGIVRSQDQRGKGHEKLAYQTLRTHLHALRDSGTEPAGRSDLEGPRSTPIGHFSGASLQQLNEVATW